MFEIFWEFGMCRKMPSPRRRTKPPNQKGFILRFFQEPCKNPNWDWGNRDSLLETTREATTVLYTCLHTWTQYKWQQNKYLSVWIWSQNWAHLGPKSIVPMHPQLRPFTPQLFLDFCAEFFPESPLNFFVITIYQVISPSPGTLLGLRVPGLGQITWWMVMTKKMRGHSGQTIARKSRNSFSVNSQSCGCIGTVDSGPKCAHSWNQIQTLKYFFFVAYIALIYGRVWPQMLQPLVQSLIGSPGTLLGLPYSSQLLRGCSPSHIMIEMSLITSE